MRSFRCKINTKVLVITGCNLFRQINCTKSACGQTMHVARSSLLAATKMVHQSEASRRNTVDTNTQFNFVCVYRE